MIKIGHYNGTTKRTIWNAYIAGMEVILFLKSYKLQINGFIIQNIHKATTTTSEN